MKIASVLILLAVADAAIAENFTKREQAEKEISEMGKALDMFFTDCGRYPTTEEGLDALVHKVPCKMEKSEISNWGPDPYLLKIYDDPWGHPFVYSGIDRTHYELTSLGADGKPGGEGDDRDIVDRDLTE